MKKSTKTLLIGSAATAAGTLGYLRFADKPKYDALMDKVETVKCRVSIKCSEQALPLIDKLFPAPKTVMGEGCARKIPEICSELGVNNVMIVTGRTVGKTIVPPIAENLTQHGVKYTLFDQVEANPSVNTVEGIRAAYLDNGCDGFLAIGGGSPMDAAKAAAARVAKSHKPIGKMAGMFKVATKVAPIICVPTTSGTGSEVTMGAVISDHDEHHKYAIMDPFLVPKYAVLDPLLTVSMPPFVTATTGIDALTHAVESYVTWAYNNNASNRNAEEAVCKIFKYILRAYKDGEDIEARDNMLVASYKAGLAFNHTGVGYVHAIAHAMGGIYNTAHGLANSVILPIVLEDYGTAVHPQLAHLAEITGVKTSGTDAEKANAFIAAIRSLNAEMGLPTGFDFLNEKDYPQIIKWALAEGNGTYPVPVIYNASRMRHVLNRIKLEA